MKSDAEAKTETRQQVGKGRPWKTSKGKYITVTVPLLFSNNSIHEVSTIK